MLTGRAKRKPFDETKASWESIYEYIKERTYHGSDREDEYIYDQISNYQHNVILPKPLRINMNQSNKVKILQIY